MVADGTLDAVRERAGYGLRYRIELRGEGLDDTLLAAKVGALPEVEQVKPLSRSEGFSMLEVRAPADPRTAIAGLATAHSWQIRAMERHVPSLEEAFLAIVGREK